MDYYSDHGHLLTKIFLNRPLPDFVKNAAVDSGDELSALPGTAFADAGMRQFPVHNPENIYVSAVYFQANPELRAKRADIWDKIRESATLFGIEGEIEKVARLIAEIETRKVAQEVKPWAIEVKIEGQPQVITAYGKTASDLEDLEAKFLTEVGQVAFPFRSKVAAEILRVAGELGVDAGDEIYKLAGEAIPDPDLMLSNIKARGVTVGFDKVGTLISDATLILEKRDFSAVDKLAADLDAFDREHGLTHLYGRKFPDPHRSVYGLTIPAARKLASQVTVGDHTLLVSDFQSPSLQQKLAVAIGEEKTGALKEAGFTQEAFDKLAEGDRKLVAQVL